MTPRRVSIQGISGSGKTTLGRELERRLGLRHLETDALVHGPDWAETPDDQLRARLEAADTVVWLDMPLRLCLYRLWRRTHRRIRGDERLWNDNKESWRTALVGWDSLFVFAVRKHFSQRRTLPELLRQPQLRHLHVVRLRSPGQLRCWLES